MAILEFVEIWAGRRGSLDQHAVREYARIFRLRTNNASDGPATILQEVALPNMRDPYVDANGQTDSGAIVSKINANQDPSDPYIWDIVVDYSSAPFDTQQRDQVVENPLDRPPIINLSVQRYQKPVERDYSGNLLLNSAGEPFSPKYEKDDNRPVLTITRNEPTLDLSEVVKYQDAVNTDTFMGLAPGTCKVSIAAESMYENGLTYWKVTYTIEMRDLIPFNNGTFSGWDFCVLDHGEHILDGSGKLVNVFSSKGQPLDDVLLDGAGHQLAANAATHYITAYLYPGVAFVGTLNLPQNIP